VVDGDDEYVTSLVPIGDELGVSRGVVRGVTEEEGPTMLAAIEDEVGTIGGEDEGVSDVIGGVVDSADAGVTTLASIEDEVLGIKVDEGVSVSVWGAEVVSKVLGTELDVVGSADAAAVEVVGSTERVGSAEEVGSAEVVGS
jgi:hypothetical protein